MEQKRIQQDKTPEKIINGGGQIEVFNPSTGLKEEAHKQNYLVSSILNAIKIQSSNGDLSKNNDLDQDEAEPASIIQQSI